MIEAGPLHPFQDLLNRLRGGALEVRILDAQNELTRVAARVKPAEQRGAQSTDVQEAGGTGGKSGADDHCLQV